MGSELRSSGIDVVGPVPWGTSLCHFYTNTQDLLDTTISFLRAGLAAGERCVWLVSSPINLSQAWDALSRDVRDVALRRERGDIEVRDAREWYRMHGEVDAGRMKQAWDREVHDA